MTLDQRIDYFRSEIEGKISTTKKELAAQLAASNERIRQLEELVKKLVLEVKSLEMSVA